MLKQEKTDQLKEIARFDIDMSAEQTSRQNKKAAPTRS